jgi:hypothetical protein
MHRLIGRSPLCISMIALSAFAVGCGGGGKPADSASADTDGGKAAGSDEHAGDGETASEKDGGAGGGEAKKKDECVGFDVGNLEDMLLKSSCEEANVKPDSIQPVDLKGKLEVSASASPTKAAPGGKVDLLVTFANKSKDPLVLHFKIDPVPRFELEVWDTKKAPKRADLPAGSPPAPPKGATQPPPSEPKAAKITIAPNGSARARIPWEAVKMKWAPEKFKGTPPERGFPRAAAGPLAKGKYNVKVLTPLVGVSEGVDHEMTAPKVEVEIN